MINNKNYEVMKKGVKALIFLLMISLGFTGVSRAQTDDDSEEKTTTAGPKYGADSTNCVMHLSLYREFYKQKNYKDALPHWRWVFFNCPIASQNTYIDGAKIISTKVDECKDPALREKLIDTLMMVYDQRIRYFNREGYVLGRKGIDLFTYRTDKTEQIYPVLKKSVELSGKKSEGAVLVYYFRAIISMVDLQKMDKSAIVDGYDQISEIIDHNLKLNQDNPKKLANWENIKANIESTFEPFATCPDLIGIYEKKYADKPDDIELLTKITNVLERKKCTDSELFFNATEKLHKLQPSAQSAYLMGSLNLEKNNISKAAEYMQEAANLFEDNTDKIRALNLLANINFNQRNYSQARANAQKILQLDPNYGKAYILIGDLYAASSSMCTEDDMGGKTVFWAAVDKYVKARSVDPSVEAEANNKIGQYSKHFPPASDLFFRDLNEGGSYTVGCWINETTTIRAAK
ncbi:tetratricopeptide repeat protein [Lentimicrobium sp.]|jgi:tetratricopeptide (TPR) repeat protein|uniref:tetratricopeptide repeat protein n=2 Tax=Lentimicrobium sp. TaxID=2034841 RepID=UPI0025E14E6A|nr:tetratricopeptide repeat protein [Lentimicrobium sp.]HPJ63617.1 hypothetical protein [Lentimicrobium sp.]HRW69331.1 hypothetical protein [Lentimicrobium sp.]